MKNLKLNPSVSFIIPLYNEADYLVVQINKLIKYIMELEVKTWEVILVENGSTDKTLKIAQQLSQSNPKIKTISLSAPNYGRAIKKGIFNAKNELMIQLDIDFIDKKFLKKSISFFGRYDILVGSKFLTHDKRPIFRKILSYGLNFVIKTFFNYQGTDTHGIKAYKARLALQLAQNMPCTKHFFDTSILIKAQNLGYQIKEIPVKIKELRPSRFPSVLRIFQAIKELTLLIYFNKQSKIKSFRLAVVRLKTLFL